MGAASLLVDMKQCVAWLVMGLDVVPQVQSRWMLSASSLLHCRPAGTSRGAQQPYQPPRSTPAERQAQDRMQQQSSNAAPAVTEEVAAKVLPSSAGQDAAGTSSKGPPVGDQPVEEIVPSSSDAEAAPALQAENAVGQEQEQEQDDLLPSDYLQVRVYALTDWACHLQQQAITVHLT